jgi:Kef-type K+ transport system membrane component KefB
MASGWRAACEGAAMVLRVLLVLRIIGFCILLALSVVVLRTAPDRVNAITFLALVWAVFGFGIYRFSVLMRRLLDRQR